MRCSCEYNTESATKNGAEPKEGVFTINLDCVIHKVTYEWMFIHSKTVSPNTNRITREMLAFVEYSRIFGIVD